MKLPLLGERAVTNSTGGMAMEKTEREKGRQTAISSTLLKLDHADENQERRAIGQQTIPRRTTNSSNGGVR